MKKIKLYILITVVSIVLLAWLLVVVIVFQKNHADIFFFDNNKDIEYQYGNYKADALVVDGYVYLYRSVVELGNYDKKEKLEKCGNNVIYRLSPDGTYEKEEKNPDDLEDRKLRAARVNKFLKDKNTNCIDGLMGLTELWLELGCTADSPHIIQGKDNSISPVEYYTDANYNYLYEKNKHWLKDEVYFLIHNEK